MGKGESHRIDKVELLALLRREVTGDIESLSFIPSWEGICYVATGRDGQRLLVKAFDPEWRPPDLGATLAAAHCLYASCGLVEVVPPVRLANGTFVAELGGYGLAVFEFVEGSPLTGERVTGDVVQELARFVAALHAARTGRTVAESGIELPSETFALGCEELLASVMDAAARTGYEGVRAEAATMIRSARADVDWLVDRVRGSVEPAASCVLTHGDLNLGNFIRQPNGHLRVIDWTKLAVAPRERDLLPFADLNFAPFLAAYLDRSAGVRLHAEHFDYYACRAALTGILDFGSLLLLEEATPEDEAYAFEQLQALLPLDRRGFDARLSWITRCVRKAGGTSHDI